MVKCVKCDETKHSLKLTVAEFEAIENLMLKRRKIEEFEESIKRHAFGEGESMLLPDIRISLSSMLFPSRDLLVPGDLLLGLLTSMKVMVNDDLKKLGVDV